MDHKLITTHQETPQIGVLTLNRPAKRNALNIDLMRSFSEEFEKLVQHPTQRAIILRGEGAVFCAGLDLEEAQDLSKAKISAELIAKILILLHDCPHVTIAAVHGAALAGGAGLMCACDFTIAEAETIFGFPETRRGLVAALIMTFLRHQLRQRDLKELLLAGSIINAEKARLIGLINEIAASKEELFGSALKIADTVIQSAPIATMLTKTLINEFSEVNFLADMKHALDIHEEVRKSDEFLEGISAFLERRQPRWVYETMEH